MHIAHPDRNSELRIAQGCPRHQRNSRDVCHATLGQGVVSGRVLGLSRAPRLVCGFGMNRDVPVCTNATPKWLRALGLRVGRVAAIGKLTGDNFV